IASWMGGPIVAAGNDILNRANIPTFNYPDTAARTFVYMWRYSDNLNHIYETPTVSEDDRNPPDRESARKLLETIRAEGRTLLTETESKELLGYYGIPIVQTGIAQSEDAAVTMAGEMGYPVVLKLNSETITHKTDVGGVKLNLRCEEAVRTAFREIQESVTEKAGAEHFGGCAVMPMIKMDGYEIILGSSLDPQFGPVVLFGLGGSLVEVFRDRALGLPPLNTILARRMMERTKIFTALKGVRGKDPVDLARMEQILVRFSQLIAENPLIEESDINPLLVSSEQIIAVDARFVLHPTSVNLADIPKPAIRSYPHMYQQKISLKDQSSALLRPIRPDDETMLVEFHKTLSEATVRQRYTHTISLGERIAHERLKRICFIDYDREMVLVALPEQDSNFNQIIAVARLSRVRGTNDAKFALLISDPYQKRGLGTQLLNKLIDVAKSEGIHRVLGEILPDHEGMQKICRNIGFSLATNPESGNIEATLELA
ncbi:MAG: GNAT family N-acetyltransferase, partial [Kiritimatiellae bacterium]|nr:GNAT family N-acetyltransferase [Kiritimatiellia bacterium]